MNITRLHPMAEDYLAKLEAQARALPDQDREELVGQLRGHLAAGLPDNASEADVHNMLDDLGPPADIVAAATTEGGIASTLPRAGAHATNARRACQDVGILEILAVVGLTLGTFLVPVVGPLAGIALAWASTRWTRSEKIVATVLAFPPVIALVLGAVAFAASPVATGSGTSVRSCPACSGRSGA